MKTNGVVLSEKDQKALQVAMALPDFRSVALPDCYQQAKAALKQCETIEDVESIRTYAQKAAFIANKIKNGELMEYARRIEARSWRQLGEVIKKLQKSPPKTKKSIGRAIPREHTRRGAAEAAGITPRMQTKALKIASIVQETFDSVVDQPGSASGSALLQIATAQAGGPRPHLMGNETLRRVAMRVFETVRNFTNHHPPETVAMLFGADRDAVAHAASVYRDWFNGFVKAARKDDAR